MDTSKIFKFTKACILRRQVIILFAGLILSSNVYSQNTYYSTGNTDPTQLTSWNDDSTGNGNAPANFNGPDTFIIKAGDSMTTASLWELADTGSQIIIMPGAALVAHDDIRIAGTFEMRGGLADIGANRLYATTGTDPSLLMSGGTLSLGTLGRTLPEFSRNNCLISGGSLILNGDGNQVLMGQTDYHNLTFGSPKGIKTITSSISNISGTITISGNDTVNVENKSFGGASTNLVMSGGRFITGGTGTRPTAGGIYNITGGTMEFTNMATTAQSIRSPESYYNIVVSGSNVKGSSGFYSIINNGTFTIAEGGKFTLTNQEIQASGANAQLVINGTLQTDDVDGFSGNTNATVNPGIDISFGPNGTVEYGRAGNQVITNVDEYENLVISGSGTKTLEGNIRVNGNLNILSATLDSDPSNSYNIEIGGNWSNQAGFTPREGKVVLTGSTQQTLSGNTDFYVLELNNSSGAEISAGSGNAMQIHNTFTHSQGTLTTAGNFYLKANSDTSYGQISGLGSGDISGAVSMQMFIPGTTEDWRNFSVPFDTVSFGQLGNQVAVNLANSNQNVYTWNESTHSWSVVNSDGNMYGKAYNIYVFNPSNTLITLSGNYTKSDMNYGTLSFNNSGTAKNDGWHLLPNPYPSCLDWNAFSRPNNMTNGYACWNAAAGNYAIWDGSTGTNGAGRYIPPMHSFWVNVSATTNTDFVASGSGNSTTRAVGTGNLLGKTEETENLVRIKISSGRYTDETVVYYSNYIEDESQQGMPKLKGLAEAPCLWSVKGGKNFAATGLFFKGHKEEVIPLGFVINKSGKYTFGFEPVNLTAGTEIWIEDRAENQMWNISKGDFSFEYTKGEAQTGRFYLHYKFLNTGYTKLEPPAIKFYSFRENGQLKVYLHNPQKEMSRLSIYDMQGRSVYEAEIENGIHTLPAQGLPKGVLVLRIEGVSGSKSIKTFNH